MSIINKDGNVQNCGQKEIKMVVVSHEPFSEVEKEFMLTKPSVSEYEGNNIGRNSHSYEHTIRSNYNIPIEIRDTKSALDYFHVAVNSRDRALLQRCIEVLDSQLNEQNVLKIYASIGLCEKEGCRPSAPPYSDETNVTDWMTQLISDFRYNCLLEIDKNADVFLNSNDILQLSYSDILAILERDTLQVSSETLVYRTIFNWASEECKRRSQSLRNKREVLQNLSYSPRYGLMTKSEFTSRMLLGVDGPIHSGVLEEKEWRLIKFYLKEKSRGRPVNPLSHKMSCPRIIGNIKPIDLSFRSKNLRNLENHRINKRQSDSSACSRKNIFEKCILSVLTCWSFVFD